MFVWPSGTIALSCDWRSVTPPSGAVLTTQCADESNATTPNSSCAVSAAAARRIASLPMSVFLTPCDARAAVAHAALERVAVAGVHRARLVDDDDERHVGLLLAVAHAHVDGERLLERRVGVAAGAVGPRPADRHEPAPEVADVDLERRHRLVGQPQPRDVDEDDRVVLREPGEVGREGLRDDRVHDLPLGLERRDELGRDVLVALDDEHLAARP